MFIAESLTAGQKKTKEKKEITLRQSMTTVVLNLCRKLTENIEIFHGKMMNALKFLNVNISF